MVAGIRLVASCQTFIVSYVLALVVVLEVVEMAVVVGAFVLVAQLVHCLLVFKEQAMPVPPELKLENTLYAIHPTITMPAATIRPV